MLSHPSAIKLLYSLSSKKAFIARVIDFILHAVYNKPKEEKSPGESRCVTLFVTKGRKKKLFQTKLLPPNEQSLHMKILRANFVSCGGANCVNQHFEILNLVDYGWEVSVGKLETNSFEESALSSIENIDQINLDTFSDVSENTDNTFSDTEDENEGICLSHFDDKKEPYCALCIVLVVTMPLQFL